VKCKMSGNKILGLVWKKMQEILRD
jgi:hypothetical protein